MNTDWQEIRLDDFIQFKNGKKRPPYTGEYPVYGGNGVLDYAGNYNYEKVVVIGRVGAYCGSVFFVPNKLWVSDNAIAAINLESSDIQYDYYLLKNLKLNQRHIGTGQPLLTQEILNGIMVPLPPLPIQRTIAATLSCLDDKIELNNRINANLEAQAGAIFKSWFVDFEPFQGGEFVDSELGQIPKGWQVGSFTSIVNVLGGGTPKTDNQTFWNGDIPFFTPKDSGNIFVVETEKQISTDGLNKCNSKLYPVNTVFITARGTVGKIVFAGRNMAMSQTSYALVGKEGYSQFFVYCLTQEIVNTLKNKANGAVFDAIVTRDFDTEIVIIPLSDTVKRFAEIVSPMFEQILLNTKQSSTLAAIRDILLPRLMSGEIEVTSKMSKEE
ncbi:MAG: hypothetical protein Ta2B_18100 [Termitinemataceae bacterium]|nr:MAG: hypothetical protein Ta2B_18100 [Termitinemataceae bacterium]